VAPRAARLQLQERLCQGEAGRGIAEQAPALRKATQGARVPGIGHPQRFER